MRVGLLYNDALQLITTATRRCDVLMRYLNYVIWRCAPDTYVLLRQELLALWRYAHQATAH